MAKYYHSKLDSNWKQTRQLRLYRGESHLEWEEANWHHLEVKEAEEGLSRDEIEWLQDDR